MKGPLSEKYRPRTLDEITGNQEVISCLKSIDMSNMPNMLFYGPPGTGKTTAIRAMLCGHSFQDVLELNASDERGIETVRERIKGFATTKSNNLKVVVLDEADSMSRDAQGALRRIMEDFHNTRFCLICNYARKIIEPIASRCTKFRFAPVNETSRIKEICLKEGIPYDEEGVAVINKYSDGDMRKVMNDIQGICSSYAKIGKQNVLEFFGLCDETAFANIFESLLSDTFEGCQKLIFKSNIDCVGLLNNLTDLLVVSDLKNKMVIFKELAAIEHRLGAGCSETVQMNGIIASFLINR